MSGGHWEDVVVGEVLLCGEESRPRHCVTRELEGGHGHGHCFTHSLGHWVTGSLGHCFTASLGHCFTHSLLSKSGSQCDECMHKRVSGE